MTRQERAELVFRIAGLVFLFKAIGTLFPVACQIHRLMTSPASGAKAAQILLLACWAPSAAVGLVLLFYSGVFARWFIPAPEVPSRSSCLELIHLGVILVGVLTLTSAGVMVLPHPLMALPYVVVAGVLIAYGDTPAEWLFRRWGGRAEEPPAEPAFLAIGLGFLGASTSLTMALSLLALAASPHLWLKGNAAVNLMVCVERAASLAMWLLLMVFAGGVSKWLGCRPGPPGDWQAPAMRRVKWFQVAFMVGIAWLFVSESGPVLSSMLTRALDVKDVGLQLLALLGVVGCVVVPFLIAAWCGARFAALFYRDQEERAEGEAEASALVFEVAVTIVAVVTLAQMLPLRPFAGKADLWFFPVGLSVGLLVLRGDIALWLVARTGGPRRAPAERFGQALRPWLIMVGVWLVLAPAPGLLLVVGRGATSGPSERWIVHQLSVCAIGAALVFASKPLSRLFSYGPLLSRK